MSLPRTEQQSTRVCRPRNAQKSADEEETFGFVGVFRPPNRRILFLRHTGGRKVRRWHSSSTSSNAMGQFITGCFITMPRSIVRATAACLTLPPRSSDRRMSIFYAWPPMKTRLIIRNTLRRIITRRTSSWATGRIFPRSPARRPKVVPLTDGARFMKRLEECNFPTNRMFLPRRGAWMRFSKE